MITYLHRESGTTIRIVEQNASKALEIATRGYALQSGYIAHTGTDEEPQDDEAVIEAYLGGH